ncbi:MAG: flagellar hook-basal body complex protein [candidate division Zixibacteria bacterium]|nr:flagellar hook-basal body complex protein [candidate division Zixibacteria bacterium]
MMASLFAGVSGLKNHQVKMNVIGNNIANINTIGFKGSRVTFQEALVQTSRGAGRPSNLNGGTNPIQLGLGMEVGAIDTLFTQGGLETTGQITDLAIQGSGFFVLGDANDNKYYTRAGAFGFDANATFVDPATGLFVQGKMADASGEIPSLATTGRIVLPFGQQDPAKETELIMFSSNLDNSATTSIASLDNTDGSSVTLVTGTATDGVGGIHSVVITGAQATQDTFTSASAGALVANQTLGSYGVTNFDNFEISVDGGDPEIISGLITDTTISELVTRINQVNGISATLTGGNIVINRDYAGDHGSYSFETSASLVDDDVLDIIMLGDPALHDPTATVASSGGLATTMIAIDTFTPSKGSGEASIDVVTNLGLEFDQTDGMVTGLTGLGGGGVAISSGTGTITATAPGESLLINTAPTIHTTSISVFDSQGGKHTLSMEFFKSTVTNRWEWTASVLGDATVQTGGTGFVQFNSDGSLNSFDYNAGADGLTINPNNGAESINLNFNAGTVYGFDGLTGFSTGQHTAAMTQQDGYGVGMLDKISIDQAGTISGIFSNGVTRVLAQIIMADFFNQAGLRKAGKSMYQESANSGAAVEGIAGETIAADISSGALESSSVDIAEEFTGMITAQRGFQANARIITTSDTLLDELVNIKR